MLGKVFRYLEIYIGFLNPPLISVQKKSHSLYGYKGMLHFFVFKKGVKSLLKIFIGKNLPPVQYIKYNQCTTN